MKIKYNLKIVFFTILFFIISLYTFEYIMFLKTRVTYGILTKKASSRGASSIHYIFKFNGKLIESGISTSLLKELSLDSLKKIDSVKIEVSEYWTFFNRIVDKRVLK